eukprot:jgi/Hompol1/5953/HPOL_001836-RA
MTHPSNSGLRSRKVDNRKPMPIIRYDQVSDLDESSALNRAIPQVATGVEKEEEEEHHLQAALVANQTHTQVVIPTPDASTLVKPSDYESFYTRTFQQSKHLIRFSTLVDDIIGSPYNLDEQDDEWIASFNTKSDIKLTEDDFERAISVLEAAGNDKTEEMSTKPDSDPYVCFRRREVKSLRKTRRGDTQALDKLKKLRDDLLKARMILDYVVERETTRRESVHLEHLIFEKRIYVRRLKRRLGVTTVDRDADATPESRRKKIKRRPDIDDQRIPMQKLRDATNLVSDIDSKLFADHHGSSVLSIEDKIRKYRQLEERNGWCDLTE